MLLLELRTGPLERLDKHLAQELDDRRHGALIAHGGMV